MGISGVHIVCYKEVNYKNVVYSDYLKKLNGLIVEKLGSGRGHDLQIGHSYFMHLDNDEDFIKSMNEKVIPLLMEYMMNNVDDVIKLIETSLEKNKINGNYFQLKKDAYPLEIEIKDTKSNNDNKGLQPLVETESSEGSE